MTQPTPQDKAKELVKLFDGNKKYALRCVTEIRKAFDVGLDVERKYWQAVKTEIEKL